MLCSRLHLLTTLAALASLGRTTWGSQSDCWNQQKLEQMKMNVNSEKSKDPKFAQFFNLFKCLREQQGGAGFDNLQWQSFPNSVSGDGSPFSTWNKQRNQRPDPRWSNQDSRANYDKNGRPNSVQPMPGVHPDDWDGSSRSSWPQKGGSGSNNYPKVWSTPPRPGPDARGNGRNGNYNRNRKERRRNRNQQGRKHDVGPSGGAKEDVPKLNNGKMGDGGNWKFDSDNTPDPNNVKRPDTDKVFIDQQESSMISRKRKYGYLIMALSVVALAILMVMTIFCCNSSNSTMSQPTIPTTPHPAVDSFSIYSFKNGMVEGSDTMKSGNLGDTLRTQTLQSRASPQYRVSDLDPELSRRFQEDGHHY